MANNMFEKFECEVMLRILNESGCFASTLLTQYENSCITSREFTGYGFYTNYLVSNKKLCLKNGDNFELGNTRAEIEGLINGIGLILFIRNGFLSMLEGYTYDEAWPEQITKYTIL